MCVTWLLLVTWLLGYLSHNHSAKEGQVLYKLSELLHNIILDLWSIHNLEHHMPKKARLKFLKGRFARLASIVHYTSFLKIIWINII